jgi:hypothetical protein
MTFSSRDQYQLQWTLAKCVVVGVDGRFNPNSNFECRWPVGVDKYISVASIKNNPNSNRHSYAVPAD